jgi:hypothetical protein
VLPCEAKQCSDRVYDCMYGSYGCAAKVCVHFKEPCQTAIVYFSEGLGDREKQRWKPVNNSRSTQNE